MPTKITVFNSKKTNGKIPMSPYGDNTFVFETFETTSNLQMFNVLVSNFVLNVPLSELEQPIRTFRRKVNLEDYQTKLLNYIILDIDNVKSTESKRRVLDFFKRFKSIIGESKSYNGIDNFNMKGVLFTEPLQMSDAKNAISQIGYELSDFCTVDECVVRRVSLNAPISRNSIFFNNENGPTFKFSSKTTICSFKNSNVEISDLTGLTANTLPKLCLKAFKTMGFDMVRYNDNGSFMFKHLSENKTPNGYFWFESNPFTMHHFNSHKSVNIFDSIRKLPIAKELMKKTIDYSAEFQIFNTDTSVINANEAYLSVTSEIRDSVQTFIREPNGVFSIRSPMGTGKSTIINHIIGEAHVENLRVLIITNRISVAQDFSKKYDLKLYNEDVYEIGDSLVCQFDSLWRFNLRFFDVVVMDEFISLMLHSRSNLNKSSINVSKFFAAFNKKLVIADAFLTGYENFLLENKSENLHLLVNSYRDSTILHSYNDYNQFVSSLVLHADKHKCTVSATSLSFINSLDLLLTARGKRVVTLTANTPKSTKELIYKLFEQDEHDKWDVLIFSPTLTVGVSNLNNVPHHFHYDSSMSTDVISSIQMMKRTRKSDEIHLFVKERTNYLKTTYDSIRDDYMGNIGKTAEQNYLFDVDDYGEPRLSKLGKKAVKIDTFRNILEFNHRDAMFWLFNYHFLNSPIIEESKFSGNILLKYQREIKMNDNLAIKSAINQFLTLNAIEKTQIIENTDSDKTLKTLVTIDDCLSDVCPATKKEFLECAISDVSFIKKCKFYKVAYNFTKKLWSIDDVRRLVSVSVLNNENSDLLFFNTLLSIGQTSEIFDEYLPKHINANKELKFVLDKCGYSVERQNKPDVHGHRAYRVDKQVKRLYRYIK